MRSGLLYLAAVASITPLLLTEWMAVGGPSAQNALFGLALCPWMVFAGLPGSSGRSEARPGFLLLAYAVPILALAWALDVRALTANSSATPPWQGALVASCCLCVLRLAAQRAADRSRWHGGLWVVLVLVAPVLGALITSFTGHAAIPVSGWSGDALSDWSPVSLCLRLAAGDDRAIAPLSLASVGATLAVLLAASEVDRRQA